MKKVARILISAITLMVMLFSVACNITGDGSGGITITPNNSTVTKLSTPENIRVDDDMVLRWNTVDNASSYLVIVGESEYSRTTPACDLKKIITKNGKYDIYVKAISGSSLIKDSELSPVFTYEYSGEIVTEGNTQTGLFGQFDNIYTESAYIGYGYDVINSPYVLSKEVKVNYPIFDKDKLKNKKLVLINERDSEDVYVSGNSMETYQQNFEASLSTKIKVSKAFSASLAAKYKSTSKTTASALFYEYRHTTTAYHLILQCAFEDYKDLLTDSFKRDLMSLDYGTLFQRYGTHVITSAVMGGRYDLNYTMLSDQVINTSELSASIGVQFKAWAVDGSIDVKAGIEETASRSNCTIESTFVAVGGDNIDMSTEDAMFKNKQKWLSSIEAKPALVGIRDVNSLVGIWELLGDSPEEQARKAEMKAVFERNGQEAYETILKNYEINPPLTPTSLTVDVVDEDGEEVDVNNVIAGSTICLKLNVKPELAIITKSITSEQSEYFTLDSSTNSIKIKKNVPHGTKIIITVDVGYGVKQDVELTVKRQYTVTFETGQGSSIAPYEGINHGSSILPPIAPTWAGYVFVDWVRLNEETNEYVDYTFGTPVVEDFTLYATWEPFYPTVTFVHNVSGCDLTEQRVAYKDKLSKYELSPEIEGYHVAGWYADEYMTTEYDLNAEITEDIKVYVKWELNEYEIKINTNADFEVDSIKKKHGDYLEEPFIEREGYNFLGWYADERLTIPADFTVPVSGAFNLYAKWEKKIYTVKFNSLGGSDVDSLVDVEHGEQITAPVAPEKEGYTFIGWYTDKECTLPYDFEKGVTSELTLYAKWKVNVHTVTFMNENEVHASVKVNYGEKVSQPEIPAKEGHVFYGWYNKSFTEAYIFETSVITSDLTLYAKWGLDSIEIIFDTGDNSYNIKIEYGSSLGTNFKEATKEGYTFKGWFLEEDYKTEVRSTTVFNASTTIYAKWQINAYKVSFNTNGANESFADLTVVYGNSVDVSSYAPTKEHYIFTGWYKESECVTKVTVLTVWGDTTLYAGWNPVKYTVNFETNGAGDISPVEVGYGEELSLSSSAYQLVRDYYTFTGWYTNSNLNSASKVTKITITGNVTLYAGWSIKTYTVSFNTNGGTAVASQTVNAGTTLNLANYSTSKDNYTFTGWFSDSGLTSKVDSIVVVDKTTLYAGWKINSYTVNFNGNGGTNFASVTEVYGFTVDLTQYLPTRENHEFTGWYSDSACTAKVANNYVIKGDATLYAGWKYLVYTVTFVWNGGTETQNILKGGSATAPIVVDALFAGWDKDFSFVLTNMQVNALYYTSESKTVNPTEMMQTTETTVIKITPQYGSIIISFTPNGLSYKETYFDSMMHIWEYSAKAYIHVSIIQNGVTIYSGKGGISSLKLQVMQGIEISIRISLTHDAIDKGEMSVNAYRAYAGYEGSYSYEIKY